MDKASPMYGQLLESIIDHMNLSNREELIQALRQANQPNPEAQQAQLQQAQSQMQQMQAQIAAFQGQAAESQARANKYAQDAQIDQYKAETDRLKVLSSNLEPGDADEKEFQKRAKVAELILKERELELKEAPTGVENANQQRMGQDSRPSEQPNVGGLAEALQARAGANQTQENNNN